MGVASGEYAAGRLQHRVVRDKQDASCLCDVKAELPFGFDVMFVIKLTFTPDCR